MADLLTAENFRQGFLLDEELMGGVSELKDAGEKRFLAFVLRHTTGEYLGQQRFGQLEEALSALNAVVRPWHFERTKACGGNGQCSSGNCSGGGCKVQQVANQGPAAPAESCCGTEPPAQRSGHDGGFTQTRDPGGPA